MTYAGISVFSKRAIEIRVEEARITNIEHIPPDPALPYVSPGFLDMQVNGYQGSDYSLEDFSRDHLQKIINSLSTAGTTQQVATIVTSPQERILRNLEVISQAVEEDVDIRDALAGIHIEGPYISAEDGPRGAHDLRFVRDPDIGEFREWQHAANGTIEIVTLAPERKGALEFIRYISERGVIAAIGHTAADPVTIQHAIQSGATLSTHLGNGSHAYIPRLKNYLWEQLAADELWAGMISDGYHLPASVVKVCIRSKGLARLILVSDAALLGGYAPGVYTWGNVDVEVYEDGHLGVLNTPYLAGAGHLLDWDLPHFMTFSGCDLSEVIPLCTVNPAKLLGLEGQYGALKIGAIANLVLFHYSDGDERFEITKTIRAGREVFSNSSSLPPPSKFSQ
ncbi:MAG: amidohydrolase family protein [bacterium]|nr:amidohydrolase family protein [bacterium]